MATAITYRTAMEIAGHEAIVRQAYKDSAGIWTWSIGITDASGHSVTRYIGKPQPMRRCLEVWVWVLAKYAAEVDAAFRGTPLTESQFAAALSFHYNTGAIGKATWVKQFKAGDIAGARKSFMSWKKPSEIVARRTKERDLFFDGKWSGTGTVTEYTRLSNVSTPVWSSGTKVNIERDLRELLLDAQPPAQPVSPGPGPTAPEAPKKPASAGLVTALVVGIAAIAVVAILFFFVRF